MSLGGIAADGFSFSHQIKDGALRTAKHPIQVFREAFP
jgi:hypothetical protein